MVQMVKVIDWFKKNKLEVALLAAILLVAGFSRLYRINEYMTFLGDEGRDARIVRRLIVDLDPVLIGPMTSVTTSAGHMYLGPLYYYLMAPAMILSKLSPVGPAVMVAFFSLLTIIMLWWLGRSWWHPSAGLTAAALYAISPTVITYSRSSWNPNVMPFFALLAIWATYEIWQRWGPHPVLLLKGEGTQAREAVSTSEPSPLSYQERDRVRSDWWFVVLGISMAFVLQSHYLGLLLVPTIGIFWMIKLIAITKEKVLLKQYLLSSVFCLLSFCLLMSPLLLFDMRHDWLNTRALTAFFTERQTTVNFKFYKGFENIIPLIDQIYGSLLTVTNEMWGRWVWVVTGLIVMLNLFQHLRELSELRFKSAGLEFESNRVKLGSGSTKASSGRQTSPLLLLLVWWLVGILGLAIYKQHIYDHYFGFLWPVPFLLTGWGVWQLATWASSRRTPGTMVGKYSKVVRLTSNTEGHPAIDPVFQRDDGLLSMLICLVLISPLIYINLQHSPILATPNRQLQKTEEIARKIVEASGGGPFNLAMIAKSNYDESYRYFLEWWKAPVIEIEPKRADKTITEQLFVICENSPPFANRDEDCNPISHPKSEIALFGWAKVEQEWNFTWQHRLFKLVHTQGSDI